MELTIKQKFRDLIPPLHPEELNELERSILAEGCRDPLVTWREMIVDGHHRYEICTRHGKPFQVSEMIFADDDEACVWIIRNQFGRRNLAEYTKAKLALLLKPLLEKQAEERQKAAGAKGAEYGKEGGRGKKKNPLDAKCAQGVCGKQKEKREPKTTESIAKLAQVSERTVRAAMLVEEHADQETKEKLRHNEVSIHRVAKDIKEKLQRDERKAERTEAAKAAPAKDARIIIGDFRRNADKIADGSLSLIFTDPPYDKNASKMLPALGEFAADKLANGGSLICYVGQTQLPAALDAFRQSLRYWWTISCVHSGRSTVMREYGINAGWKAVLWFVKKTRDDNSIMVNDTMSGGEEKSHHDWQQSQSEAEYWIEKLCPKDGIVCDPFLGGGTTAAAAQKLGREWIGMEVDEAQAAIANGRISQ